MPLLRTEQDPIRTERIEAEFNLMGVPIADMTMLVCPEGSSPEPTIETQIRAASLIKAVRRIGGSSRTVLSTDGVSPTTTETDVQDGDRVRSYRIQYGAGYFDYEYERTGEESPVRGTIKLPAAATIHDLHSALLMLRAWKPRLEEQAHFYIVLGRRLWRVEARSAGRGVLMLRGTPKLTTRIDGEARRLDGKDALDPAKGRRTFSLWIEEGAQAVPVQVTSSSSYGDVTMTLVQYQSSPRVCEP